MNWLFYLAVVTLVGVVATLIEFAVGNRSLHRLRETPPFTGDAPPKVSIIVAGRNEERKIETALESVLAQDYRNLEFIVVDDRSVDSTGKILDRMAQADRRLRVVHITELPKGWLGKNHAHTGAQQSGGELILFTDADVMFEPTTVSRAVNLMRREKLDHLAIAPDPRIPGMCLSMFVGAFTLFFGLYAKPWKARDPKSKRHIGIGAFNLVRAEAYRAVGGHSQIAMRPDDDMKLGKVIKLGGYRQDMVLGADFVSVEWYSSFGELVRGLEKNSYAGLEYNLAMVVAASVAQWTVFVWPYVALAITRGATWWLNVATVVALALLYIDNAGYHQQRWWHFVSFPFMVVVFQYIIWRATLKTIANDGIDWRGTHYSLTELKANRI